MRQSIICILGLALLWPALSPAAASKAVFPFEVTTEVLDNGLTVVMVPFDSPGIVAWFSVVRAGSRNEVEPGLSGFAHFFEHMMFRGTERFSTEAYNDLFKVLGSDANAYTSDDVTVYHALFGKAGLEQVVDAESDRFMNLKYSESDFRQEAKAVLGEYNKNFSNPIRRLFEDLRSTAYDVHTYKHTTMGFIDDIVDMPNQYEYSLTFFDRWYTPGNTTLLVVGDFVPEEASTLVRKYYGGWNKPAHVAVIPDEPEQTAQRSGQIEWEGPTLPYLAIGYKKPAYSTETPDNAALDILAELVFSATSPLYQKLVVEEQVAEYVRVFNSDRRDPGLFTVYTRIKSDDQVAAVQGAIEEAVRQAALVAPDAERFAAVKSHLRYQLAMSLDTAESVASQLVHFIQLTGDPMSINAAYHRYEEVTPEDIQHAAARYLVPARSTVITLTGASR